MTKKEHEQKVEQAVKEYALEMKQDRDRDTLNGYERRLRAARKVYSKGAEAYTTGGEKNRAYALGACVMGLVKEMEKEAEEKKLIQGTVQWQISEDRVKDPDGKKGYRYNVAVRCLMDEPAYTDEEIEKEIEDTQQRIEAETREMFADILGEQVPVEDVIQ